VPIDADKHFTGNLFTLLNPFGLLGGLTTATCSCCTAPTSSASRRSATCASERQGWPTSPVAGRRRRRRAFLIWNQLARGGLDTWSRCWLAAGALVVGIGGPTRQS
jgi:cytochrome bd ubiquinol oxidase subunit II